MQKSEQNTYLWVLPNKKESSTIIKKEELISYSVIEPFDGKFSYDVWVTYRSEQDIIIKLDVDGINIYENMRLPIKAEGSWYLVGNIQLVKGEHKLELLNKSCTDIKLDAILITRDGNYVASGMAENHRERITAGEEIDALLTESGIQAVKEETQEAKSERLKKLYRMGFIERFDQDASEGRCRNGVPMGGIGAGKVELDPDGVFTAITINNNCDVPIYKTEGSFFAIRCDEGNKKTARLLQKVNYNNYKFPCIQKIDYNAVFPHATLNYIDGELPVEVKLDAFSFLIPNDIKNSSLPSVVFEFSVKNITLNTVDTSIMFSWENLIGTGGSMVIKSGNEKRPSINVMNTWNPGFTWSDRTGSFQQVLDTEKTVEIRYCSESDNHNPSSYGNYTVLCEKHNYAVTYKGCWDVSNDGEKLWDDFVSDGILTESNEHLCGDEDTRYIAGALCQKTRLESGESKKLTFVLAWHMPNYIDAAGKNMGVYYTNYFENSWETSRYILDNYPVLLEKTLEVEKLLKSSTLPVWLTTKLLNDMFPIYTCSWFSGDGKFSINEAPAGMMGCLGTMDQRLSSNVIYTNFFKELDKIELDLFAKCQGKDGSISHDLGFGIFDICERGGTWSDLCSSFVLQIYKHYLYTGDRAFFESMYPHIKRAVEFQKTIDFDCNGIPDVGPGHGTTYDTYHWYGTSAFVASLWLCQLKACIHMAELMEDREFIEECTSLFTVAVKSMIDELWTDKYGYGGYFVNYNDKSKGKRSDNCFIAQLAGQWFADLMDLGYLLPEEKVKEAIHTITKRNVFIKDIKGMNDETTPEGDFAWYAYSFVQYDETYYGCLAIYNDFVSEGLESFIKVNEMSRNSPWNIVLTHHADGRIAGLPYYMTNPASFFILEALSGYLPDVVNGKLKISPHIGNDNTLSIPLFSPSLWIWLDYEKRRDGVSFKIKTIKVIDKEEVVFKSFITEVSSQSKIAAVKICGKNVKYLFENGRITVNEDFVMSEGSEYEVSVEFN